jgi:hypothetical protein
MESKKFIGRRGEISLAMGIGMGWQSMQWLRSKEVETIG